MTGIGPSLVTVSVMKSVYAVAGVLIELTRREVVPIYPYALQSSLPHLYPKRWWIINRMDICLVCYPIQKQEDRQKMRLVIKLHAILIMEVEAKDKQSMSKTVHCVGPHDGVSIQCLSISTTSLTRIHECFM
jgi:hypothetical protein